MRREGFFSLTGRKLTEKGWKEFFLPPKGEELGQKGCRTGFPPPEGEEEGAGGEPFKEGGCEYLF